MDPYGHLAPWLFKDTMERDDVEIRPTIAITRAHMKVPELEESVRVGRLVPDGKICINETGEVAVTKVAVEPVWYLPGVAERFGIGKYRYAAAKQIQLIISCRRGDSQAYAIRGDWWFLPGAHHPPRYQTLPSPNWWFDCLHFRRPSQNVRSFRQTGSPHTR